jgi:hypothetical protein
MKAPYHFSRDWDQKVIDQLSQHLIFRHRSWSPT